MSDFKLVADSPRQFHRDEVLQLKPDVLKIPTKFSNEFYGNNIKHMIDVANKWERLAK
jgi:hypothetical protein